MRSMSPVVQMYDQAKSFTVGTQVEQWFHRDFAANADHIAI